MKCSFQVSNFVGNAVSKKGHAKQLADIKLADVELRTLQFNYAKKKDEDDREDRRAERQAAKEERQAQRLAEKEEREAQRLPDQREKDAQRLADQKEKDANRQFQKEMAANQMELVKLAMGIKKD